MKNEQFLSNCTSGGCGAKIGPNTLNGIFSTLPAFNNESLLVGFDSSDDAAVYQMNEEQAIISTIDFFSPMVDDPRRFGRIAAANALSDVYAMGGDVLFALNMVCFPEKMDIAILGEVLQGGAEKIQEAGALLCGGHSIFDKEPKYGLAVTGQVHPKNILQNNTCQTGDRLILTKPIGTGIVMAAYRGEVATDEAVEKAIQNMERLNKYAADCMKDFAVHACTDVTGFGLLAHAAEMAGDKHSIYIQSEDVPYIEEAHDYASEFILTAAGQRNRLHMQEKVDLRFVPFVMQELMFDPQTSGGLLISVGQKDAEALLARIQEYEPKAMIIGHVEERDDDPIYIR